MDSMNHEVEMEEDDTALPPMLHPEPIHPQVEDMEHADCAGGGGGGGDEGQESGKTERSKRNYQRYPKPPYSYVALICLAITRSTELQLTLRQIFSLIGSMFPFFTGEYKGWRDSVRHNLSANKCFSKVLKDPSRPGCKGNHWTLDIDKVPPEALLRQNTAESRKARSPYPQDLRPYLLDPGLRLWTCSSGQDEASARDAAAAASAPRAEVAQPLPQLGWTNSDAPVPLYRPPPAPGPALASALERFRPSPPPLLPPFSSICDVSAAASSSSTPFLSVAGHFLAPLAGVPTSYQPLVSALPPPPMPDDIAWGDASVLPSCPSLHAMSPHPASSAPSSSLFHLWSCADGRRRHLPAAAHRVLLAPAAAAAVGVLHHHHRRRAPPATTSSSASSSSSIASSPFSRSPSPAPGGQPPPPGPVDVCMALASPAGQRRRRHRHQAGERQCQRRRRHERRDTGGDGQRPLGMAIPSSSASSSSSSSSSASSSADAAADAEGRRSWHAAWLAQPWQCQPGNANAALGNNYNMATAVGYGNVAAAHGYAHGNVAAAHGYGNVAAAHGYGNVAAAHGYGNMAAAHGYAHGNVAAAHGYGNVAAAHGYGNVAATHGYGNVVAAHGYAHGNVATAVAYGNPAPQALVPWELPASHSKFTPPNAVAPPAGPDSLAFLGSSGGGDTALPALPAYRSPPSLSCSPSPSPSSSVSSSSLSSSLNPSSPPLQLVSYWVRSREAGLLYQVPTFLDYERVYGIMPPNKSVFDLFLVPASPAAAIQPGVPFPSSSSSSSSSFPQGR
ncbi:forkhead box protein C1-like [Lethenteron reissneri]|uniref:forkhead box protein C1-like n=1 Tax=Lethenteron reissneri TaxID=7753 RepID=UPI002AB6F1F0|nr:forkhead box protein C1-like [Lethenteron reissneri]